MSMNKTCPISNFTSEGCSDGMKFLLSQDSQFNESIPIHGIPLQCVRNFVNVAPLQFGEEDLRAHGFFCRFGTLAKSIPIRRKRSAKRVSERRARNSGRKI